MELGTSHMHFGPDLSVFDLIIDVGVYYGLLAYSFFCSVLLIDTYLPMSDLYTTLLRNVTNIYNCYLPQYDSCTGYST